MNSVGSLTLRCRQQRRDGFTYTKIHRLTMALTLHRYDTRDASQADRRS